MSELSVASPTEEPWKQELLRSYGTVDELVLAGLLDRTEESQLRALGGRFKVRVTPYYARLMKADASCPIRKQAIPELTEEDPLLPEWARKKSQEIYGREVPWDSDAIGDLERLAAPRLTHRYSNRAIVHVSSMCAVYCRFCFRKGHLNDQDRTLYEGNLDRAFEYLARTAEVQEIILTGGDPLSLTDAALEKILERASMIPHLKVIRIHSRMAVTLPARLTAGLASLFARASDELGLRVVLVSHFNHSREVTTESIQGLSRMRKSGVTLLNQSVLLKGINDSVAELQNLFQSLYRAGVLPYYLHHPDWTPGTFHFRPSIDRGRALMADLRGRISGPALPDYVLDIPQGFGKISLMSSALRKIEEFIPGAPSGPGGPNRNAIAGAVYEVTAPHDRSTDPISNRRVQHRYLDLFRATAV